MISLENQHFKLNRFLLLIIGLWPLQQSNLTRFQFIFLTSVLMTSIIFQFTTFITSKCTPIFIVRILSSISFFSTFAIKCNLFYLNIKAVGNLLMQLQNVCNELEDKNEIDIMKKYSYNAKRYTTALTILAVCSLFASIVTIFWSSICFIILSINVTQSRRLPITMEYFIDQEKHFYLILIHISLAVCIGVISMIAIGAMLIAYFQHTCGMFKISSHRIKCAIPVLEGTESKKMNLIQKRIISAVNIHRQAMILSKLLASKIEKMLFYLIMVGVICLSLNLFRIVLYGDDVKEILFPLIFVTFSIIYMFVANYVAQDITDHNNDFFATVYDVQWYEAPLHIQKLILFLLQKGTKEFTISVGGLFVGSLECFATLVKASVSYFTVIYSTQ
ncbi:hypothetical protein ACFW04_014811 [Cataglyphis niger]